MINKKKSYNEKLKVILISHAYIPNENQKNLSFLAKNVDLKAIVHQWHPNLRTKEGRILYGRTSIKDLSLIVWVRPFYIKGQGILCPFGRILRSHNPDVINLEYAPWSPLTIETLALAKIYAPRAKIVLFVKKNTYIPKPFILEKVKLYLRKVIDKKISAYIATSRMTKNMYIDLLGIRPNKIYVCNHMGVDLELFSPVNDRPEDNTGTVVIYCGTLHSKKGVVELVEAVRRLVVQKRLLVQLRLVGEGPLRAKLEYETRNSSWLRVEGPVPHRQVATFLRKSAVFAFPSRNETDHQEHDAHALMEAMAVGLPAVTTKSGIIPEITDKQAAFFVQENSPGQIAERVAQLVISPELRKKMGCHARLLAVKHFGLATLAHKKTDIYKEICDG